MRSKSVRIAALASVALLAAASPAFATGNAMSGLEAMRPELDDALEGVAAGQERAAALKHRAHLLEVNHRYAQRLLALQEEWLEEAEAVKKELQGRILRDFAPMFRR